jgi:hypothetical protein
VFQVAATANGVTYTGTVPTPKPYLQLGRIAALVTGTGSGNSGGGVSSSFGMTTLFAIGCVTLGAFSVFI